MRTSLSYLYLVLAMGFVTYLLRMLPATLLSKKKIPKLFVKFLKFIPAAVLSALLFQGVFIYGGRLNISFYNPLLVAAIIAFPIAYKTKNMFATVLVGMGIVMLFNHIT